MDDIFSKPRNTYKLSDFKLSRMVLSPAHWRSCKLPVKLAWRGVKFHSANTTRIPEKAKGVYTFVVKPGIADHPSCSYLMYVGKAEDQVLRDRFRQYFAERAEGEKSRRPHVTEMLLKWEGFLWFYYAAVANKSKIKRLEDQLLAAYLPPTNRAFPSKVRRAVANVFAQ
jgi:excinuclease UvrABC nuclease subunit